MSSTYKSVNSNEAPSEVVVVGGSAAGLFSAYLLAREGVKVRLFDANDVMNMAPRTLIVTSGLREALGFNPTEGVVNEIDEFRLCSSSREVTVALREADLVVERAAIVKLLAEKAIQAGATIQSKSRLMDLRPGRNGIVARMRNAATGIVEEVETRTLIGADGTSSSVGRFSKKNERPETVPLLQAIVPLPTGMSNRVTKVWFHPKDTPYFYWMIPHSETEAAVGFIADEGPGAWEKLEQFLHGIALKPLQIQASRIPLYSPGIQAVARLSGSRIYLVGDAAAQVKVTTVGGLVTGLRGAKAAAGLILGRADYANESTRLQRELLMHSMIRKVLNRFGNSDYDKLLGMLNERLLTLLSSHTRDQLASLVYRLVLAQPRLISLLPAFFRRQRTSG